MLGVKHCELYDEGWRRIGCIGCPMSSHKQKMIENKRYPHVKRGWIKAIKAIRNGGYSEENISGGTSARTGCLSETSEDCSGRRRLHQSSRPETLDGGGLSEAQTQDMSSQIVGCKRHLNSYQKDIWRAIPKRQPERQNRGVWNLATPGFHPAPLLTA